MLLKPPLSDQQITDSLDIHYGIKATALTLLPGGADMNALTYKVDVLNQLSYFIKLKKGDHHNTGIAILEWLHQAGIQHIIPPVKTLHGRATQHIDGFTLIVYPFIDGENGFNRILTDEQWLILGKTLRQIHDINVTPSIQRQIRHETYSPQWRERVRSFYTSIQTQSIDDNIALTLWEFMQENAPTVHRMLDRAEQLAKELQHSSPKLVLCHSDIHGGNVLMKEDKAIYIVDWDNPIIAPKERDLMFMGGGVGNVWNNTQEEALFYKGYGKTDIHKTMLAYYRYERIVEDIAEYGQALLLTVSESDDRAEMYKQFMAMFEPNGVVEIALKTDQNIGHQ